MGRSSRKKKVHAPKDGPPPSAAMNAPQAAKPFSWKHVLVIFVICVAAYSNTIGMKFVWDDFDQIKENPRIKSLQYIPSLFTSQVWAGIKGEHSTPYYRPLFSLSLAQDYYFWGGKPRGFHITNILLHAGVSILVYLLALEILGEGLPALFAALIFAVHPVHAEVVAWISGRPESLAALFMFISLYLYIRYRKRNKTLFIVLSLISFFLALLSQETAITLPAVILLYELCFTEAKLKEKMAWPLLYGLATAPYFILRALFLPMTTWRSIEPLLSRIYTSFGLVAEYLRLLVLPVNLKVFYDIAVKKNFFSVDVILPFLLLAGILSFVLFFRKHDKRFFFSVLWIFVTLSPVAGVYVLMRPALMADRYLYIPSAGFSIAAALLFQALMRRLAGRHVSEKPGALPASVQHFRPAPLAYFFIVVIIAPLFVLNVVRNRAWADQYHYMTRVVQDAPNHPGGYLNLGQVLMQQKKYDAALGEFQKVLSLDPAPDTWSAAARDSIGTVYLNSGRLDEAVAEFREALKLFPGVEGAKIRVNLGVAYRNQGRLDDAVAEFQKALQLKPDFAEARNNLGAAYLNQNRLADAASEFEEVIRLKPDYDMAHLNLAVIYIKQGRLEEAADECRAALRLKPSFAEAHYELGVVYEKQNRLQEAAGEFQTALQIKPGFVPARTQLELIRNSTNRWTGNYGPSFSDQPIIKQEAII